MTRPTMRTIALTRRQAIDDAKRLEQIMKQLRSSTDPEELRRFALQGVAREIKIVRRVITGEAPCQRS
jgi:hypothetical protein